MNEFADRRGQAEGNIGDASRGRREESNTGHTCAEQLRVSRGERHDRHPTHRMPDQHYVTRRSEVVYYTTQILAKFVDGRRCTRSLRSTMTALIPENEPSMGPKRETLEVP